MDITKKENEKIINPLQKRDILHIYSDKLDKQIMVYCPEEIFVEKVRSLLKRTRPRDLYDVWYLNKNVNFDKTLFEKKCKFKKLEPNIDEVIIKQSNYEKSWKASLIYQLPELPSAAEVFDNVVEFLKKII